MRIPHQRCTVVQMVENLIAFKTSNPPISAFQTTLFCVSIFGGLIQQRILPKDRVLQDFKLLRKHYILKIKDFGVTPRDHVFQSIWRLRSLFLRKTYLESELRLFVCAKSVKEPFCNVGMNANIARKMQRSGRRRMRLLLLSFVNKAKLCDSLVMAAAILCIQVGFPFGSIAQTWQRRRAH